MLREIPKIEQTDPNIKERKQKTQSFQVMNVNERINTTQKLTFKEPQEGLHEKLKTEYSAKI